MYTLNALHCVVGEFTDRGTTKERTERGGEVTRRCSQETGKSGKASGSLKVLYPRGRGSKEKKPSGISKGTDWEKGHKSEERGKTRSKKVWRDLLITNSQIFVTFSRSNRKIMPLLSGQRG